MPFRLFPWRALTLLALLLTAVPKAGAEPIQWSYQGQVTTTGPSYDQNGEPLGSHVLIGAEKFPGSPAFPTGIVTYPSDRVQFSDVAGSGTGPLSVTAFQMGASTDFGAPFSSKLDTFTLGFGILDKATGQSGSISFTGALDGRMGSGSAHNGFVELFVDFTGKAQQSLVLGGHLYQVSIDPYHFVFNQDLNAVKQFPFVTPYQGVPVRVQVSDVPEPSTLALAALGLSGLGLRAWRRRRRLPMSLA
jgi:hypothetical protein